MEDGATVDERLKRALMLAISSGYQLDRDAFTFLQASAHTQSPEELVKKAIDKAASLPEKPLFITRRMLEDEIKEVFPEKKVEPTPPVVAKVGRGIFRPYAKEVDPDIEILEDPTEEMHSTGSLDDFLKCFRNRFTRIERILRRRLDAKDAVPLSDALEAPANSEVKTIGFVTEKRERKGMIFMRIEDHKSVARVLVPPTADRNAFEKAQNILLDQVICVQATKGKNDLLIATDIIWPDIPERRPRKAYESVYAALISDLHVGSKFFLNGAFSQFLSWLRGQVGNSKQREIAGKIKYVVIAGDLVDGIGVYPNQEQELAITDIHEQYRAVARLIEQIPEYIEVIIIPGNHDPTRQALPQPAIPRKYAGPLYDARKVTTLGNPARIRLHGVELLLSHGRGLDDVIGAVPGIMYRNIDKTISRAMKLLLKARHLAPVYGKRTPIAPEPKDFLVIDEAPDILHAGHVHVIGYEMYRGTLILNSGAWQTQTEYQRKMGLSPTPGIAPIVDLETLHVMPINFLRPDFA